MRGWRCSAKGLLACAAGMLVLLAAHRPAEADSVPFSVQSGSQLTAGQGNTWPFVDGLPDAEMITAPPDSGTASMSGFATAQFTLSNTNLGISFENLSHASSRGFTYSELVFRFTPTQDLHYAVSGSYDLAMDILLKEVVSGAALFNGSGTSLSDNGTLSAGTAYQLSYLAVLRRETSSLPSADGTLNFALSPTTAPVPLPAAAWGGLTMMGLIGAKRLRRKHADA